MRNLLRLIPVLCMLALAGAAPAPGASVGTSPVRTFAAGTREPMLYPTSVAVDATGRVWVADGARDRVLVFAADGGLSQTIKRIGGIGLSRPMGIAISTDGRVWIADAGNKRIAVTGTTTVHESSIAIPADFGSVDLTDVAVNAAGTRLWAVDNDGNRVLTLDVAKNKWTAAGKRGTAWGSFNRPREVAVDAEGRTFVTDILNGRVQRFDAKGAAPTPIVRYGASAGQVFRPGGIDVAEGRVWLTDSVLGVIQVFTTDGVFIDAVRDGQGNVLHLSGPLGIDVVGDAIYVVESSANRVTQLSYRAGGGAPLVAAEVRSKATTASQGQECSLCHLDFVPPLDEGVATALVAVPEKKGGLSWAGTEKACLSCHDGSVLDSRKHIWSGYAHPTRDAVIPATMKIPEEMPLVDGKIACRTCHSAHTLGGSAQQHRSSTMMRVNTRPSELCVACHGANGGKQ